MVCEKHDLYEIQPDSGLYGCKVCGCAEGSLLSSCPGFRLTGKQEEDIMSGKIADFIYFRTRKYIAANIQKERR